MVLIIDFRLCVDRDLWRCKFCLSAAPASITSGPVTPRPALRKTRNLREVKFNKKGATPPVGSSASPVRDDKTEGNLNSLEAAILTKKFSCMLSCNS